MSCFRRPPFHSSTKRVTTCDGPVKNSGEIRPADHNASHAGIAATTATVPANIKLAARLILAHLWQSDQQGFRPEFGSPDESSEQTPAGFAIPRRAYALLEPYAASSLLGFA